METGNYVLDPKFDHFKLKGWCWSHVVPQLHAHVPLGAHAAPLTRSLDIEAKSSDVKTWREQREGGGRRKTYTGLAIKRSRDRSLGAVCACNFLLSITLSLSCSCMKYVLSQ